jgi:LemA protein
MYLRYRQSRSAACNPSTMMTPSEFTAILTHHKRSWRTLASLLALALVLCALSGCGINRFPTLDEQVKAAWSEVLNQYQRRADLIPNLVQTVKGYAHQEQQVLTQVVEARAKATQMQLPADVLSNPQAFHQFEQNQAALGGALGRLLAVSENYPNLKSNENFLTLQSQLEGTENRIAVARRDYILAVQEYNTALRSYPGRWLAAWFYPELKVRETFTITEQAEQVPEVNF